MFKRIISNKKRRRLEDLIDPNDSVVSAQSSFVGNISGKAGARILGTLRGDIQCEGLVRAEQTAVIKGNIQSPHVILKGNLEGDIRAAVQVELGARARMLGDIETELLSMVDGCFFKGQIRITKSDAQPTRFTEKRRPKSSR
jgi:cytoskeletal protein CcmA (bactofilin family)